MVTWKDFASARPDLAEIGRRLLYQYKVGYAFLATVRKDGGPRLHPACPALTEGHLYIFIDSSSPRKADLMRDGRYALHTYPPEEGDEEFYCTGKVEPVIDPQLRETIISKYHRRPADTELLFELKIECVLHTFWENWPTPAMRPVRTIWHAPTLQ
jgi:hypothetical protein